MIKIEDLYKSYGGLPALRAVDLEIDRGERLVVLGPSGCGKTTLLRLIAGFIVPDRGRIWLDGLLVAEGGRLLIEPENRKIGMVFQDLALWPHMTVFKNLDFGLKARRIPRPERKARIMDMLAKVQILDYAERFPKELSGGQQQRVALARALILEPKVLLMDEPLSNLDYDLNRLLREEIVRLQEELRITILYVTHDLDEAFFLGTRIVVMEQGRIKAQGDKFEIAKFLRAESRNRFATGDR
jgi:ABC-type sugar transport system ATPase subunit